MKNALRFLFGAISIFMFAVVLDNTLVVWFHEQGHLLAASVLGVKVVGVDFSIWDGSRVGFLPTGDWRTSVLGFAGGLFASLCCLLFLVLAIMVKVRNSMPVGWPGDRAKRSPKRSLTIDLLSFFLLNALVADVMFEFAVGLIEGSSMGFYHVLCNYGNVVFSVMILGFSAIALTLWNRNCIIDLESE